jgi:catechol 2,3-dioxygenase-like lactoylglutathione lyase family enzyme
LKTRAFSHLAIGVKDMETALGFYRDLLGLKVDLDRIERGGTPDERRAVYLRWEDGPDSTFIVLGETKNLIPGEPLQMNQLGYHHFAFWVEDLEETLEKLKVAGVTIRSGPHTVDSGWYGEDGSGQVMTTIFEDPDGNFVQLDQRVS